jgi:hypothetical protein
MRAGGEGVCNFEGQPGRLLRHDADGIDEPFGHGSSVAPR